MDQLSQYGKAARSLACAVLLKAAEDLRGRSELWRCDAQRFCTAKERNGVFTLWSDASGLGKTPAEMRQRLLKSRYRPRRGRRI